MPQNIGGNCAESKTFVQTRCQVYKALGQIYSVPRHKVRPGHRVLIRAEDGGHDVIILKYYTESD